MLHINRKLIWRLLAGKRCRLPRVAAGFLLAVALPQQKNLTQNINLPEN